MKRSISYNEYKRKRLENAEFAKAYLEASIEAYQEDGDRDAFLEALQDIAAVHGAPIEIHNLDSTLKNFGYRISLEPIQESAIQTH